MIVNLRTYVWIWVLHLPMFTNLFTRYDYRSIWNTIDELYVLKCLGIQGVPQWAPRMVEFISLGWIKINTYGAIFGLLSLYGCADIFWTFVSFVKGCFYIPYWVIWLWGKTCGDYSYGDICWQLWEVETLVGVRFNLWCYSFSDCITLNNLEMVSYLGYLEKVTRMHFYYPYIYRDDNKVIDSIRS